VPRKDTQISIGNAPHRLVHHLDPTHPLTEKIQLNFHISSRLPAE
jgi:hypothetical protein